MSYVLDALRKSEQERHMASGQSVSMLYPVMVEQRRSWPVSAMLAGAGFLSAVAALVGWLGWQSSAPGIAAPLGKSVVAPPVVAVQAAPLAVPARNAEVAVKTIASPVAPAKSAPKDMAKKNGNSANAAAKPALPGTAAADKTEPIMGASPKDLPALTIAGYIRDEQAGSLAMINDKLVREGEEVSPGLRLEKILGDGSVFNYKGYRFRR